MYTVQLNRFNRMALYEHAQIHYTYVLYSTLISGTALLDSWLLLTGAGQHCI